MLGSVIWIAPAVFAAISHVAERRLAGEPWPPLHEILFSGGDWLIYAFLAPLIFWVVNRWPIVRPYVGRRMGVHFLFALLTCVLWATGGKVMQFLLINTLNPTEAQRMRAEMGDQLWQRLGLDLVGWIFMTLPFGVIVYICVAGIAHAIRYFVEARDREVQMARLSEQLTGARFAALQAQVNPHFLFNTLNTIAVRARDGDGAGTARMVEQLSDVLRRTLSRHRANEVTLEEELELVRAVPRDRAGAVLRSAASVVRHRSGQRVPRRCPSFALQHLVENAIRHGIAQTAGRGTASDLARGATATALELTVTDDGAGLRGRDGSARTATASRTRASGCARCTARTRRCRSREPSAAARSRRCACRIASWPWRPTMPALSGAC